MGLMNRVLHNPGYQRDQHDHQDAVVTEPPEQAAPRQLEPVPSEPARRLEFALKSLEMIPGGIGFPGAVFDLLAHTLSISAGAFLARDIDDNRYKVWAHRGIDPTTRGRLILKRRTIDELVPERVAYIDETKRSLLGEHLSVRERSMQEPLLLCRFETKTRLCGLLVVFRSDELFADSENAELLLAALSEPVARVLHRYRESPLQGLLPPLVLELSDFRRSIQTTARRLLSSTHGIVLTRIRLRSIADSVLSVLPSADRYQVTQDIRRVAAALFAASGDVSIVEPDTLLAAVTMPAGEHGELLLHQLSSRFGSLFPELPGSFAVEALVRQWPVDSDDIAGILDTLLNHT